MSEEYSVVMKILENVGITGLVLYGIWRLVDKWGGKFLDVQTKQAEAMGDLASAVRESQSDGKEILLAVRVMAAKVDEQKKWIEQLDKDVRGGFGCRAAMDGDA